MTKQQIQTQNEERHPTLCERIILKILKRSHDCLLSTKKETNRVLFIQEHMTALLLPHV